MQDFPANSRKAEEADPPTDRTTRVGEAVTTAQVSRRKRGLGRKFRETFIVGDARSTSEHVMFDVLIPAVRDMLYDAFDAGVRRMIFGESSRSRPGGTGGYSSVGHVNYAGMNKSPQPGSRASTAPQSRSITRSSRARHDFHELIIPDRHGATEVIDQMFEILSRYGSVSVADLYELTGIESSHTDIKWGWTQLRGAKAVRQRNGGFLLDLPEPQPLG